jgi:hypothetical protein
MRFQGSLKCPRCGGEFSVGFSLGHPPTFKDEFEVICPSNRSRFRFRAADSDRNVKDLLAVRNVVQVDRFDVAVLAEPITQ